MQGFTEFLPISSSGHVSLLQSFFHFKETDSLTLNLAVHGGTLFSIIYIYRKNLFKFIKNIKTDFMNIFILFFLGTLPAVTIGFFFKKNFEIFFTDLIIIGYGFIFTGAVLYISEKLRPLESKLDMIDLNQIKKISSKQALLIGLSQSIALIPGVSRSGLTFSTGLLSGLSRSQSATFSFMLAIPINFGAIGLQLFEWKLAQTTIIWTPLIFAFITSFIFGCLALKWILSVIKKGQIKWFSPYLILVGSALIVYLKILA